MKGYSKYRAWPVTIDGIKFSSQLEGNRYKILKLRERAGDITGLELQPQFILLESFDCRGKHYRGVKFKADFTYYEGGQKVVEEIKGYSVRDYPIRKKLFLLKYGDEIEFREVKK